MFRISSNVLLCVSDSSVYYRTLNLYDLQSLFAKLSIKHFADEIITSPLRFKPSGGIPGLVSRRISEFQFDTSPRVHRVSKASSVPDDSYKFILPTLPEGNQLTMEPLNWEFGVRCNRPFESLPTNAPKSPPRRPSRPRPRSLARSVTPDGIFEQPNFWEMPAPIFDPYNHQTEQRIAGPLKLWFESLMLFLIALGEFGIALVLALWDGSKAAAPFIALGLKVLADTRTWEPVVSMLLATQLVRLLPGMEGNVQTRMGTEVLAETGPLYVMRIPMARLSKSLALSYSRTSLTNCSQRSKWRLRPCEDKASEYL